MGTVAAHLGSAIRSAMKHQGLSGRELAERVARLTGRRHDEMYVSRRLSAVRPLVKVSEDLLAYATILNIDPAQMVADAVRAYLADQAGDTTDEPPGGTP